MEFTNIGSEENDIIKQFPGKPKGGQFQSLLFSLILQPVRINKPGAPLLGLAKSIYYFVYAKFRVSFLSTFWFPSGFGIRLLPYFPTIVFFILATVNSYFPFP